MNKNLEDGIEELEARKKQSMAFDTDTDGELPKKTYRESGSLSGSESNAFLYANRWYMQLKNCQLFQEEIDNEQRFFF